MNHFDWTIETDTDLWNNYIPAGKTRGDAVAFAKKCGTSKLIVASRYKWLKDRGGVKAIDEYEIKSYSDEDEKYIIANWDEKDRHEIATDLGVTPNSLSVKVSKMRAAGIKLVNKKKLPTSETRIRQGWEWTKQEDGKWIKTLKIVPEPRAKRPRPERIYTPKPKTIKPKAEPKPRAPKRKLKEYMPERPMIIKDTTIGKVLVQISRNTWVYRDPETLKQTA